MRTDRRQFAGCWPCHRPTRLWPSTFAGTLSLASVSNVGFKSTLDASWLITFPAGNVISQLASNVALKPTFETLARLSVPANVDGHSLVGLWHGQQPANWRRSVLIEHHGPDHSQGDPDRQAKASADPPSYEAIRTANALYVLYADGKREYYDTASDPLELDNIAAD